VTVSAMCHLAPGQRDFDIDNALKLVLDAMSGCVYHDDRQVVCVASAHKFRSEHPRTKLTIWEAPPLSDS
jgi:Holliday junction resolvase RusA-like endonuclease